MCFLKESVVISHLKSYGFTKWFLQTIYCKMSTWCLPSQVMPSPVNPFLQVQLYEPSVLLQLALSPHGPGSVKHSSKSGGIE